VGSTEPNIDPGARQRLTARFGREVEGWFDELPGLLAALAERWKFELGPAIPRGSVSTVFRCRMADGRRAILKASPDRSRLTSEAEALAAWHTVHTPAVFAFDENVGALLLEEIEPGTPLGVSSNYPAVESAAELLGAIHVDQIGLASFVPVAQRVGYLFHSSAKLYERRPNLESVISPELYERGKAFATHLAQDDTPVVLLHGDLTPNNILEGGRNRGLVAIDPAPCLGDAAFDAIDLIMWQADNLETIEVRIEVLAAATGVDPRRQFAWCSAFAGMNALELASQSDALVPAVDTLRRLALRAGTI
jgi:streptomycin 6-kinase